MVSLSSLRGAGWPARLTALSVAASALVGARILLLGVTDVWGAALTLTLSVSLCGATLAALLLALTVVERVRGRPLSARTSRAVWLALGLAGGGLAGASTVLLARAFDIDIAGLTAVGVLAVGLAVTRARRDGPPRSPVVSALILVAAVLLFQSPRERGVFSLRWSSMQHQTSTSTSGGDNCTGVDLGDRPASIAAHRPRWVINPMMSGAFGQLVNQRLGTPGPDAYATPGAFVTLHGQVEYGDVACYTPLTKRVTIQGAVSIDVSMQLGSEPPGAWSLSCSGGHTMNFTITSEANGVASCRDLATAAAVQLAEQLIVRVNALTGH